MHRNFQVEIKEKKFHASSDRQITRQKKNSAIRDIKSCPSLELC